MKDLINFRDFGGLPTLSGQRVRTDRLYRCGQLKELSDEAIEQVLGLDFTVIADLRYLMEQDNNPSPWPDSYAHRVISHGQDRTDAPHLALLTRRGLTLADVDEFYLDLYRNLPFDRHYRDLFAEVIKAITQRPGRTLVHCAAGKDRTGVLCAMILDTLGVGREAVLGDYLASAGAPGLVAMKPAIVANIMANLGESIPESVLDALIGVKPAYLEAALAEIEAREGSVAGYLRSAGVTDAMQQTLRDELVI